MRNQNNRPNDVRTTREYMEEYRQWYENWRRDHWNEKFRRLRAEGKTKNTKR